KSALSSGVLTYWAAARKPRSPARQISTRCSKTSRSVRSAMTPSRVHQCRSSLRLASSHAVHGPRQRYRERRVDQAGGVAPAPWGASRELARADEIVRSGLRGWVMVLETTSHERNVPGAVQ